MAGADHNDAWRGAGYALDRRFGKRA